MNFFDAVVRALHKKHGEGSGGSFIMPTIKTEGYAHAGLRQLLAQERELLIFDDSLTLPALDVPYDVVLWNGGLLPRAQHAEFHLTHENPAPLAADTSSFSDLARALTSTLVVRITASPKTPLSLGWICDALRPAILCSSLRIEVAGGIQASIILEDRALSENHLHLSSLELVLEESSSLDCALLANAHAPTSLRGVQATVHANAKLRMIRTVSPTGRAREEITCEIFEGAHASLRALMVQKTGHTSLSTRMVHKEKNASSMQIFRSAVFSGAEVDVDVRTDVAPHASGTSARQETKHLLMEEGAKAYTVPRLFIHNDDVVCSHGATMGHATPELLSYMATRGIGEQRAKALLALGHMAELAHHLPASCEANYLASLRSLFQLGS